MESSSPERVILFPEDDRDQLKVFIASDGLADASVFKAAVTATGGLLSDGPQDAKFILCNGTSIPPNLLAWKDHSKVFLNSAWLPQCINAHRLLLEHDNYGGCLIQFSDESHLPSDRHSPSTAHDSAPPSMQTMDSHPTRHKPSPTQTQNANALSSCPPELNAQIMALFTQQASDPRLNAQLMALLRDHMTLGPSPTSLSTHSHSSSDQPIPSAPSSEKVFTNSEGQPFQFQVDIQFGPQRSALVQKIKANGGQITAKNPDFVIFRPHSIDYSEVYYSTQGQMVKRAFVDECIWQQRLLDPLPYLEAPPAERPKKIVPQSTSFVVKRKPSAPTASLQPKPEARGVSGKSESRSRIHHSNSPLGERKGDEVPQKRVTRKSKRSHTDGDSMDEALLSSPKKKKIDTSGAIERNTSMDVTDEPPLSDRPTQRRKADREHTPPGHVKPASHVSRIPSPTPPPTSNRRRLPSSEKFKYTTEEYTWAAQYIEVLLIRNPEATKSELAQRLHIKTSHHSAKSWEATILRIPNFDFVKIQKRAGIAFRKSQNAPGRQPTTPERFKTPPSTNTFAAPPPPSPPVGNVSLEENVRRCANFFALREGDDLEDNSTDDENAHWNRLARLYPCPDGFPTWRHFYDRHHEAIGVQYSHILEE